MDVYAIATLAFVASITPGPNNLMLWASGLNHGIRPTLRHLAGVNLGFALLVSVVAMGLGSVFQRSPAIETTLKLAGGAYLLLLAYRLATSSGATSAEETARPMTFLEAAAFQWLNPKAWVMATTATATGLASDRPLWLAAVTLAGLFSVINLPCITTWMVSGSLAARFLRDERAVVITNRILAGLLAATVVLIVA